MPRALLFCLAQQAIFSESDAQWMRLALEAAARGLGRTSPNPPVGCALVSEGEVVGVGHHARAGSDHAEVVALREAGARARGATAYVTLEPCTHHGRTPPCSEALLAAGIRRAVIATLDPDPRVSGRGRRRLLQEGVEVATGLLAEQALEQQAGFRSRVVRGRPWVTVKWAMTLDGKVATPGGESRWISGEAARQEAHRLRDRSDLVAVGSGTVLADDPALTTRLPEGGRDAVAVLFDRSGKIPLDARAVRPGTVVVTAPEQAGRWSERPVRVLPAPDLEEALTALASWEFCNLLLEGGPGLTSQFLAHDLIDEVWVALAPKLLGAGLPPLHGPQRPLRLAAELQGVRSAPLGGDLLVRGRLHPVPELTAAEGGG